MKAIFKFLVMLVVMLFLVSGCERLYGVEDNSTDMPDIEDITDDVEDTTDLADDDEDADVEADEEPEEEGDVIVYEGELVNVQVQSRSGIDFSYSDPLNESGQWETKAGDAGVYNIAITASDGKTTSTKTFKLVVKRKNKAPKISSIDDFEVTVGDTIIFDPEVSDPDGDDLEITYSGWMNSNEKEVTEDDVGEHKVTIKVSDGQATDVETVKVTVLEGNRAPVIKAIDDIEVFEGDTIEISPEVSDPDGDDVTITFGKPLDEGGEWQTGFDDAGDYTVTITASDGEKESEIEVDITVLDKLNEDDWDFEIVIS